MSKNSIFLFFLIFYSNVLLSQRVIVHNNNNNQDFETKLPDTIYMSAGFRCDVYPHHFVDNGLFSSTGYPIFFFFIEKPDLILVPYSYVEDKIVKQINKPRINIASSLEIYDERSCQLINVLVKNKKIYMIYLDVDGERVLDNGIYSTTKYHLNHIEIHNGKVVKFGVGHIDPYLKKEFNKY